MIGLVTESEHRLNGQRHALLECDVVTRLVVMEDDKAGVEGTVDPVPGVVAHHAVPESLGVVLDDASDDGDRATRLDGLDGPVHGLLGVLDEVEGLLIDVAAREGVAIVAVHVVLVGGDVDFDDVAVLQRASVRDAVADDLVDAGAAGLGVVAVVEGRRVGAVIAHVLVSDAVELVGGDSRCHSLAGLVHGAARDPTGFLHGGNRLGSLHVGTVVGLRDVSQTDIGRASNAAGNVATRTLGIRLDGTHVGLV